MILSSGKMILSLAILEFCCGQEWDVIFSFSFSVGNTSLTYSYEVWYPFINQRCIASEVSFPRTHHICPPRSQTWTLSSQEVALLLVSTKNHDLWPDLLFWAWVFLYSLQSQIWAKVYELQTSSVGPAQRSQFLVLNKLSRVSGDESETWTAQCRLASVPSTRSLWKLCISASVN